MKNKKIVSILYLFLFLIISSSCSKTNQSIILEEVADNNTQQTRGSYILKNKTLNIDKEFAFSKNINQSPSDYFSADNKEKLKLIVEKEFPNPTIKDELFQTFKREVSNVTLTKNKSGLTFKANEYVKEFKYVNNSEKRVTDELGIEYSINSLN